MTFRVGHAITDRKAGNAAVSSMSITLLHNHRKVWYNPRRFPGTRTSRVARRKSPLPLGAKRLLAGTVRSILTGTCPRLLLQWSVSVQLPDHSPLAFACRVVTACTSAKPRNCPRADLVINDSKSSSRRQGCVQGTQNLSRRTDDSKGAGRGVEWRGQFMPDFPT